MVAPTSIAIVRVHARHPVAGTSEIEVIASPFGAKFTGLRLAWTGKATCTTARALYPSHPMN